MRWENEFAWTEERVEKMIALREQGVPFSQIAERFGVTKNAIIGKFNRIADKRAKDGKPIEVPSFAKSSQNGRTFWTPERERRMVEMRKIGRSYDYIAIKLGCGPTTVIRRFREIFAERAAAGEQIVIAKIVPTPRQSRPTWPRPLLPQRPLKEPVSIPESKRVTFEEIRAGECRWVLGEPDGLHTVFCGNPVERRSFCADHLQIAFYNPDRSKASLTNRIKKHFKLQNLSKAR